MNLFNRINKRDNLGVIIFPAVALVIAVVVRIFTGNSHVFYACNCGNGVFPGPGMYFIIYVIRIILSSFLIGLCIYSKHYNPGKSSCIIALTITTLVVILEYKTLIGNESYLVTLALIFLSIFLLCKVIKGYYRSKSLISALSVALLVIQSLMVYFIVTLII